MVKFHTGYFFSFGLKEVNLDEISQRITDTPELNLISENYSTVEWKIEWIKNDHWNGYEFIIESDDFETAQNVLFLVKEAQSLLYGTTPLSDEAHYPHELGKLDYNSPDHDFRKPIKGFSNHEIHIFFYIAKLVSKDLCIENALIKYGLSIEIYSKNYMDVHELVEWKTTRYSYIQMRFAYSIMTAYAVIEELGCEIRASKEKPSRLDNGEWNPIVIEELNKQLRGKNINIEEDLPWFIRGMDTEIEKIRSLKIKGPIKYKRLPYFESDLEVKDSYITIQDAIQHISFLRSRFSAHAVKNRVFNLSIYDVTNSQFVARRLLLEILGMWHAECFQ